MSTKATTKAQQQAGTAVAEPKPSAWAKAWDGFQIEINQRANEIGAQLPSNVTRDRFINVTIAAVKQTPTILTATPRSLFAAIAKAAQDGLMPDGREGVITVYSQKIANTSPQEYENVAQWNPMAYGLRKRARELDGIIIDAQVVFDGDDFEYELGDAPYIRHKPKPRSEAMDASAGIAVYAIFRHQEQGILHREVMWKPEVFATMNQSKAKTSLMWTTFWTEGWRKACVRRGMKSVPVSPKLEALIARNDEDFDFGHDPSPPRQIGRTLPPAPPSDDEIDGASTTIEGATNSAATATKPANPATTTEPPVDEKQEPYTGPDDASTSMPADAGTEEWFGNLTYWAESAGDQSALDEVWRDMEVNAELAEGSDARTIADELYERHRQRLELKALREAGQGDLLGGGENHG